jgi:hypothetical protein
VKNVLEHSNGGIFNRESPRSLLPVTRIWREVDACFVKYFSVDVLAEFLVWVALEGFVDLV